VSQLSHNLWVFKSSNTGKTWWFVQLSVISPVLCDRLAWTKLLSNLQDRHKTSLFGLIESISEGTWHELNIVKSWWTN
jgi:hypothetical protein